MIRIISKKEKNERLVGQVYFILAVFSSCARNFHLKRLVYIKTKFRGKMISF